MSRKAATITQAEVSRVIRAAKETGARKVEVRIGRDAAVIIWLESAKEEEPNSWNDR